MSRSGYSDDCDQWTLICYRGAVKSAIRGKRGQAFLRELREALDALPEPKLCDYDFQRPDGMCCAIGAVGKARGIDMTEMDPEYFTESGKLSEMFDIANSMVREIEWKNDDPEWGFVWYAVNKTGPCSEWTDKHSRTQDQYQDREDRQRWSRMRAWADEQVTPCQEQEISND